MTPNERFWAKVNKTEGCWLWTGRTNAYGYGVTVVARRSVLAHRVAYESIVGAIPQGGQLDQFVCHNRACVNPAHLRIETNQRNGENRAGANRNSATGVRGVSLHRPSGLYRVQVERLGVRYNGGYFATVEEAERAAIALRNKVMQNNLRDRVS